MTCVRKRHATKTKEEDKEEEPFDPSFDGSKAFESSIALYPADRREYDQATQALYFEAIGEIRKSGDLPNSAAVATFDSGLKAYAARQGKYAVAFSKYLRSKMYLSKPTVSSELLTGPDSLVNRFKAMRGGQ
jgi:hypothetical protein